MSKYLGEAIRDMNKPKEKKEELNEYTNDKNLKYITEIADRISMICNGLQFEKADVSGYKRKLEKLRLDMNKIKESLQVIMDRELK